MLTQIILRLLNLVIQRSYLLNGKNCIFTILFLFSIQTNPLMGQEIKAVIACCDSPEGKCTGSAYCSACKNCKYCGYCNSGGSCGVCNPNSSKKSAPTYNTYPKYNTPSNNKSDRSNNSSNGSNNNYLYSLPDDIYSEYYLKTLVVNTHKLNLRSGPGSNFSIISSLERNDQLIFYAISEDWVKVKVIETGEFGFVASKYLLVIQ